MALTDKLRAAETELVEEAYERLGPYHNANAKSLDEFSAATTPAERRAAVVRAEKMPHATEPRLELMRRNSERLGNLSALSR